MFNKERDILAFIHIEKAGGQTFIRILENNFLFYHCRVAPFKKESGGVFQYKDLKKLLSINPFTRAISGHSIQPHSDLNRLIPNIKYITVLRNPVDRYISHYQYWIQKLGYKISFEEFMEIDKMKNFQIKKLAGSEDLALSKKMIDEKLFLVGVLDEFDYFLKVLAVKLSPRPFNYHYQRKNVAIRNEVKKYIEENYTIFEDKILKNNSIDIELYDYVKNVTFQKEKDKYLSVQHYESGSARKVAYPKVLLGKLYRNLYFKPIFMYLRYKGGLKVSGSY